MKKWNNPEIVALNISETALPSRCTIPGGVCNDPNRPSNNGNGYCKKNECPYFRKEEFDSSETGESDIDGLS